MIDCPTCQQPNLEGASFCIYCGGSLPESEAPPNAGTAKGQPPAPAPGTLPGRPASGAFHPQGPAPVEPPPPPPGILSAGTLVDGKYTIESVLGEGGMGVVYLASDIHTRVQVVVKAIRTEYAHRPEFKSRILAEGRALATIDHNNVVRLNAVVVEPDALYLVMQFIEGESLDKTVERYVAQQTPMPLDLVLKIFHQVLDGVGAAHREGVIHRDLKPANILIRQRDAVAKVTDFGIAKAEEDAQAGRGQTKGIIGSLLYMAPEQIKGRKDLDKRVDIYGLGILLYELLVGRVPFDAPSEFEIMKMHLEGQVPMISQMRPDIPPYVDAVIQKACAKKRDDRFASTQEMAAALHEGAARAAQLPATAEAAPAPEALFIGAEASQGQVPQGAAPVVSASSVAGASTNEAVTSPPEEPKRSMLGWVVGLLAVASLGAGGVWGAWYYDLIDFGSTPSRTSPLTPATVPPVVPLADAIAPDSPAEAKPTSPLAVLAGAWVSDSGMVYDASMSGETMEFRLRDAESVKRDGYVDGETRFSLDVIPGETRVFAVKDKIRPALPAGLVYDFSRSRNSCQEVRTEVNGKPLQARFDGSRLTVEVAKIAPLRSMFLQSGSKVYGCVKLSNAKASLLQSALRRQ
jgi:eukaryotic-like serine/threonine-protein kinase